MAAAVFDLGMSGRDVCTLVADVRAGAGAVSAALAEGALSEVAEAALPELVVEVAAAIDRLTTAQALIVARVHASGVLRDRGVVSTKAWLATHTRTFALDAAATVGGAPDLHAPELAPARDALLGGQVTVAQHRAITRGLRRCERSIRTGPDATLDPATARALLYADGQDLLLAAAVGHGNGPDDLERLAVRLRHLLDPDGTGQSAIDADLEACLSIRVVGDMTDVRGCLDLDGGAARPPSWTASSTTGTATAPSPATPPTRLAGSHPIPRPQRRQRAGCGGAAAITTAPWPWDTSPCRCSTKTPWVRPTGSARTSP